MLLVPLENLISPMITTFRKGELILNISWMENVNGSSDKTALSEQLAHSAVDLRLKEISEFLHGSEMNKNPTLP